MSTAQSTATFDHHPTQPQTTSKPISPLHNRAKQQSRPHPPRLQHSPSLPNLWLPPHFGPIPPQFINLPRDNLHQPSTPPFFMSHSPLPDIALTPPKNITSDTDHVRTHEDDTPQKTPSKSRSKLQAQFQSDKIHRRHRIDHDHPHLLLTPPLTPSSSIRTTGSVESGISVVAIGSTCAETENEDDYEAHGNREIDGIESPMDSTRFLLLENVSRNTPSETLKSAFVGALSSVDFEPLPSPSNNPSFSGFPPIPPIVQPPSQQSTRLSVPNTSLSRSHTRGNDSPIKGMFVRYQRSHGVVILAFFDVRDAVKARGVFAKPRSVLAEYVGDGVNAEGEKGGFGCRFVTVEELIKLIGDSPFLSALDGGFFLSVEGKDTTVEENEVRAVGIEDEKEQHIGLSMEDGEAATDIPADRNGNGKRDVNPGMLKGVLSSFGGVRAFTTSKGVEGDEHLTAQVFYVEYYDIRDANAAYTALDDQVLFGMKLRVSGREVQSDDTDEDRTCMEGTREAKSQHIYTPSQTSSSSKNYIPFPSSPAGDTNPVGVLQSKFGAAGQQSQTRERFLFIDAAARVRPRSVSAGNDGPLSSTSPPSTRAVNPNVAPIFLHPSSPPLTSDSTDIDPQTQDVLGRRISNHLFFDAVGKAHGSVINPRPNVEPERPRSLSFDTVNATVPDEAQPRDGEVPGSYDVSPYPHSHPYESQRECYYCPSRGPGPAPAIGHAYYNACPTPAPSSSTLYYPQPHTSPPIHFPPLAASTFGYDYDLPSANTNTVNVNMRNWAFEHAMMIAASVNSGAGLSTVPTGAVNGDHWYPHTPGIDPSGVMNGAYYPQPLQHQHTHHPSYYPLHQKLQMQYDTSLQSSHLYVPNLRPPTPPSPTPVTAAPPATPVTSIREPPVPPERNQLNLSRIEDGQDTRTTVMIKNIPNKMSDKDLIAYIGKVHPRKIDFLYLRMDFQNGCNVGYAFVNFIHVQDLLAFAKAKLGEKWNMFSSEKVLQMSYANYQGKEALVEKFKNSCIMDEREAWRPKIFYSDPGPEQGLPEPFPAPTHLRRKERSSYNRGALFVPGLASGPANAQNPSQTRRHHIDQRPHQSRRVELQRERGREVDDRDLAYPGSGSSTTKKAHTHRLAW